jgi:outer membrane protein OmpA-like peptidoglycan-associated protein
VSSTTSRRSFQRSFAVVVVGLSAALAAACGGESQTSSIEASTTLGPSGTAATDAVETTTTLRAGAQPGLFDFNQDGTRELTCGTADFRADLIVRTYCDDLSGYLSEPAQGAALVPASLLRIPGPPDDPRDKPITEGASVQVVHLQGGEGKEVVVLTLSSDTVFAVGSDKLQDPALASLDSIAVGIKASYPGAAVQVRGHTDATGSPAANQALSERRAAAVARQFETKGIDKSKLRSVGLGQAVPNYLEKNADGSDNTIGRDQNRRIEIVIRPA